MNLSGEFVNGLSLDLLQLITNYFIAKLSWYMMTWTCLVECFDFNQSEVILATTGIGRPPGQMDPKTFLLKRLNATAEGRTCTLCSHRKDDLLFISKPQFCHRASRKGKLIIAPLA
ncbi:unnamed protein product [Linum trigynum]|uniref:Uncharacterized protein n=1 Tax=Linum trigynum TaxID=586398 RepID=A0AAV2CL22_9ROSI